MNWICPHNVTFRVGKDIPPMADCRDYHENLPRAMSDEDVYAVAVMSKATSRPPQKIKEISKEKLIKWWREETGIPEPLEDKE